MSVADPSYYIQKTAYKGFGLFAKRKIFRGELIISEQPLFTYDRDKNYLTHQIEEKIKALSIEDKKLFNSLFDCYLPNSPTPIGIAETNSLPLGSFSNIHGIFATISRINHSCVPNVYHSWNCSKKFETVYALKDIEKNEEIVTSYIDLYADTDTRKNQLKKSFRFICCCQICKNDSSNIKKSDIRRKVLSQLDQEIALFAFKNPEKAIVKAEQLLKYLKDEDMYYLANYVGRIAYDVFQIMLTNIKTNKKLSATIGIWARLVIENFLICSGNYDDCNLKDHLEIFAKKF